MKKAVKPRKTKQQKVLDAVDAALTEVNGKSAYTKIDFADTKTAFAGKSDADLKKAQWLFRMMSRPTLVNLGTSLGMIALKLRLPFTEKIIKETIFSQFVGGRTLLESQTAIEELEKQNVLTILDYGAEAKTTEEDYNKTMNENIRAIEFAAGNASVPIISTKVTGMARFGLLESVSRNEPFTKATRREYKIVLKRLDSICHTARERGVGVFFDAEETWIQDAIDHFTDVMMRRYNRKKAIVYNTFQMYRKDRLPYLLSSFDRAQKHGYILGAKLVRGAYMEKEAERAEEMDYPNPIHPTKAATDDAYNQAVRFCVENYERLASCNASHNAASAQLQARLIAEKGLPKNHPHLNFCQLYGMSDNLTFNLADAGYNVAKYVPYGSIKEVVPYLIRRANENTSVSGDMTRELSFITEEVKRRGI